MLRGIQNRKRNDQDVFSSRKSRLSEYTFLQTDRTPHRSKEKVDRRKRIRKGKVASQHHFIIDSYGKVGGEIGEYPGKCRRR